MLSMYTMCRSCIVPNKNVLDLPQGKIWTVLDVRTKLCFKTMLQNRFSYAKRNWPGNFEFALKIFQTLFDQIVTTI